MRVVIFFCYLCFLLLRGGDYVHAGTHHYSRCYSPAQNIEKTLVKVTYTSKDHIVIKHTSPHEEKEYLISDDVEDEDTNNVFARKYRLLTKCYLTLSHTFISSYLYSCFKGRLPFYSLLSYKYITQGVLRI